jgi:hypothetical protein
MKTFYIGPYKNNTYLSLSSNHIINDLGKNPNIKLSIKPIYLSKNDIGTQISYFQENIQGSPFNSDVVIQHCPYDWIISSDSFKKSIIIPIIPFISKNIISCLKNKQYDELWTDNSYYKQKLADSGINNVKLFTYSNNINTTNINSKYNIDIHTNSLKFYFIGRYDTDQEIISKIITAFLYAFREEENRSLLLFLDDADASKDSIGKMLQKKLSDLKIVNRSNRIKLLQYKNDNNHIDIIHNTGDIFLNLNTINFSNYNYWQAIYHNKPIIDITDVSTNKTAAPSNYTAYHEIDTPSEFNIQEKLLQYAAGKINKKHKQNNNLQIEKILKP